MKKKRILSLLLAAIMTATSLPILATTASAATGDPVTAEVGVDLLYGVTPTGTETIRSGNVDTNRGGYLHVGSRASGAYGLGLNFNTTFETGETYFLSFDVRSSVSVGKGLTNAWPVGRLWLRVGGDTAHTLRGTDKPFKYWELSRIPGTGNAKNNKYDTNAHKSESAYRSSTDVDNQYIMLAANFTAYPTGANVYAKMQNAGLAADYVAVAAVSSGWTSYEVMLPEVATTDTNPYVAIFGAVADDETAPFDIDNIRLYKRDKSTMDGQENLREQQPITPYLAEYTFDSAPAIATNVDAADDKGNFFVTNGISRPTTLAQLNGATLTYVTADEAYSEIDRSGKKIDNKEVIISRPGNDGSAVTTPPAVTYTQSAILTPGIYELTGEFRDGWHTNGKTSFDNSSMKLTPTINVVGDGDITLAQAQLCTEWTPVSYRFVISADTTLENVTFASSVNETLQFRDVSLVKVGDYVVENTAIESGILAEPGVTKNYTGVVDAGYDLYDIESDGKAVQNGYITAGRQPWVYNANKNTSQNPNGSWLGSAFYLFLQIDEKLVEGTQYGVSFSARKSTVTNEDTSVMPRIEGINLGSSYAPLNDQWEKFSFSWTATKNAATINFDIRRAVSCEDAPVDFDHLTIWVDTNKNAVLDAGETTLYSENYNNPDGGYIAKESDKLQAKRDGGPVLGQEMLYHNFEETYAKVSATGGVLSYTDLELKSGVYTFNADLQIPYFLHIEMRNNGIDGQTTGFNWNEDSKNKDTEAKGYYEANDHDVTVTFNMEDENGTPITKDVTFSKHIDSDWNSVSASVIVDEGCTLTGVSVVPTFSKLPTGAEAVPDANKALNFKNVSLVRDGGYVDQNTPIENPTGLLANANKSYTADDIVDCEYDFNDYETNNGDAAKNGYITAGKLIWWWDSGKKETTSQKQVGSWVSNNAFAYLEIDEKYDANTTFGISFRAREHVDNNESSYIRAQFNGTNTVKSEIGIGADWTTYSSNLKIDKAGDVLKVTIRRGVGCEDAPADIDDLIVWYDTDGDAVQDAGEKVIYSENFNAPDGNYIGTGKGKITTNEGGSTRVGKATVYHNFDETYAASETLTYENLNIESGVYTFTADLRIPYHDHMEMRNNDVDKVTTGFTWTATDGNAKTAQAYNDHTAEVKFILTRGTEETEKIVTVDVTNTWNPVTASVIVDEGCTLSKISVTPKFNSGANDIPTGLPLNFKNVNLVESGVVGKDDLEFDDAENFLNAADENYVGSFHTAVEEVIEDDKTNGFITVDRRKWEWSDSNRWYDDVSHEGEPEGYTATLPLINLTTSEEYSSDYTYYFAFDVRHNVPTNTKQKLQLVFTYTQPKADDPEKFEGKSTNVKVNLDIVEDADGWMHVVSNGYTPGATDSGNVTLYVRRYQHEKDVPLDFDNLVVWKEKNDSKNGTFGDEDASNIIYQSDFNAVDGDYLGSGAGKISNSKATPLYHNFDEKYDRLAPEDTTKVPVLTYTDLNGGNGHGEGVYIFSADFRIPYFKHVNISSKHVSTYSDGTIPLEWPKGSDLEPFYALNDHNVTVTFTMEPISADYAETAPVALTADINFLWSTIDTAVVVPEGYKLTKIEIKPTYSSFNNENVVPNEFKAFDFKNVSLSHSDLPIVEAEGEDNFLDGVKPEYENVVPVEVIEDAPDGELYVSPRTPETSSNFLVITTGEAAKANREYFVSYDISNESSTTMMLRTLVNVDTVYQDGVVANKYIDDITGSAFESIWFDNNGDKEGGALWNHYYINGNQSGTFKGHFTPSKDISNLAFTFHRGDGDKRDIQALTIDNFRIWYVENGVEKDVYNNNFDSEGDGNRGISGNSGAGSVYTIEHMLPVTHTRYTPVDPEETMSVTYELGLTVDEAVEGKYSFKTMVKLAESTDMNARARVIFNFSDGTSDVNYIDLTEDWSYIGKSDWLERYPDLESITLEFDSDVPVMLIKPELTIFYKYTYGRPNRGIVMVLLKKLQGKMVDPWKQVGVN